MNQALYYLLAVTITSVTALISVLNTYILLRDRKRSVSLDFYWAQGYGVKQRFIHHSDLETGTSIETLRPAVLIENLSQRPVSITSCFLKKTGCWPFIKGVNKPLITSFSNLNGSYPFFLNAKNSTFVIPSVEIEELIGQSICFRIDGRKLMIRIRKKFTG